MSTALDFAKIFIKRGLDTNRNTYDGNMKLQKLLFFAMIISLAEKGTPLFSEPIYAFTNGCVVENVRLRYKNDCANLCNESEGFEPSFTQDEYDVINLTTDLFGNLSARELSNLNHSFDFWKNALARSEQPNGYRDKQAAIVTTDEMLRELDKIRLVIQNYKERALDRSFKEIINGVAFFYPPDMQLTDELLEYLDGFSMEAEDTAYTIYLDDGNLVIY